MSKIRNLLQQFVVRTNSIPILRKRYVRFYQQAIKSVVRACQEFPQIETLYLRHSLTSEDWIPGLSDIDFSLIIKEVSTAEEITFLNSFWSKYAKLKFHFPFLGEVEISTRDELNNWLKFGGLRALRAHKTWQNLYGPNNLRQKYSFSDLKFKIDRLNAALECYHQFSITYFYQKDFMAAFQWKLYKSLSDLFIYSSAKVSLEDIQGSHRNHLLKVALSGNDNLKKDFELLKDFRNPTKINELSLELYFSILSRLDKMCKTLYKELSNLEDKKIFDIYKSEDWIKKQELSTRWRNPDYRLSIGNELFAEGIYKRFRGDVDIVVLLENYSVFIVLKTVENRAEAKNIAKRILNYDLFKNLNLLPLFLTKSIFNCLSLSSIYGQEPFFYYKIANEKTRFFSDFKKQDINPPPDIISLIQLLEFVVNLSIGLRMYPYLKISTHFCIHSALDNFLKARLALEHKIILFTKGLSQTLREPHLKLDDKFRTFIQRYLDLKPKNLVKLKSKEVFYQIYPFIKEDLKDLNNFLNNFSDLKEILSFYSVRKDPGRAPH